MLREARNVLIVCSSIYLHYLVASSFRLIPFSHESWELECRFGASIILWWRWYAMAILIFSKNGSRWKDVADQIIVYRKSVCDYVLGKWACTGCFVFRDQYDTKCFMCDAYCLFSRCLCSSLLIWLLNGHLPAMRERVKWGITNFCIMRN